MTTPTLLAIWDSIGLTETGGWTIATATLASMACSTIGVYLVVRRMSLVGDALSHSVLPGFAIAALITGGTDPFAMLLGAVAAGVLTTWVTHLIRTYARVPEDAALGVTFTAFFAAGMAIISINGQGFAIDPHIVLYGDLTTSMIDQVTLAGLTAPRIFWQLAALFAFNLAVVAFAWRMLKVAAFDESYARAIGLPARTAHIMMMALTAITIVMCFRAVGAILVIALIVIPAAGAYLLTDRLGRMIAISWGLGFGASILGRYAARWADTNVTGSIGAAHGVVLLLVFLAAPRYGVIARIARHVGLSVRMVREDILALLWRVHQEDAARDGLTRADLLDALGRDLTTRAALASLRLRRRVHKRAGLLRLAASSYDDALHLVRRHRVWESWLHQRLAADPGTVHPSADRMMHVLPDELATALRADLASESRRLRALGKLPSSSDDASQTDPHGRPIP